MKTGSLLDLLLPRCCGVCGQKLLGGENCICTECIIGIPLTYFWTREHNPMADKLNERLSEIIEAERPDCSFPHAEPYAFAIALYFYKGNYRNLSKALKYDGNVKLGRYISSALGRKVAACEYLEDVDLVIPVPLHFLRQWKRGYNQAEIIAESVCVELNGREVSVNTGILKRRRRTKTQTGIDMGGKAANVAGAFSSDLSSLEKIPRHILLVDDVFTSGSTLAECHRTLRKSLVARYGGEKGVQIPISVATLAFVGE